MQKDEPYILKIETEEQKVFSPWWSKIPLGKKIHQLLFERKWPRKIKFSGQISFEEPTFNNMVNALWRDNLHNNANDAREQENDN